MIKDLFGTEHHIKLVIQVHQILAYSWHAYQHRAVQNMMFPKYHKIYIKNRGMTE